MRSDTWLRGQLDIILGKYFKDVDISNPVEIKFGRYSKFRFGSIRLLKPRRRLKFLTKRTTPEKSLITITKMFANPDIPEKVIQHTICHELCHYAHGFSSSNKRLFKFPHHGGIVNRELKERGAEDLIHAYKVWLKDYRKKILSERQVQV